MAASQQLGKRPLTGDVVAAAGDELIPGLRSGLADIAVGIAPARQ